MDPGLSLQATPFRLLYCLKNIHYSFQETKICNSNSETKICNFFKKHCPVHSRCTAVTPITCQSFVEHALPTFISLFGVSWCHQRSLFNFVLSTHYLPKFLNVRLVLKRIIHPKRQTTKSIYVVRFLYGIILLVVCFVFL